MFEVGKKYTTKHLISYEGLTYYNIKKLCAEGYLEHFARGCYEVVKPFRIVSYGNLKFITKSY